MRRLGIDESFRPVPIGDYVAECIRHHALPTSRKDIQIEHVYIAGDERHTHVLLHCGIPNVYLVIALAHPDDVVFGHHILDLNEKYGLTTPPV